MDATAQGGPQRPLGGSQCTGTAQSATVAESSGDSGALQEAEGDIEVYFRELVEQFAWRPSWRRRITAPGVKPYSHTHRSGPILEAVAKVIFLRFGVRITAVTFNHMSAITMPRILRHTDVDNDVGELPE